MATPKTPVNSSATTSTATAPADERCPVVEFEYPDSMTSKMRLRYLKLTEANGDYIKGYELDSPTSKKDGQFKTFSRNRLTRNSPTIISF